MYEWWRCTLCLWYLNRKRIVHARSASVWIEVARHTSKTISFILQVSALRLHIHMIHLRSLIVWFILFKRLPLEIPPVLDSLFILFRTAAHAAVLIFIKGRCYTALPFTEKFLNSQFCLFEVYMTFKPQFSLDSDKVFSYFKSFPFLLLMICFCSCSRKFLYDILL